MSPIYHLIITALTKHRIDVGPIQAFAFGSAVRPQEKPNDIDLLIIYKEEWQPKKIRHALDQLEIEIHLIFMLSEEEEETNFIVAEQCIALNF